ncbi:S9 family peptidase [Larkinella sp. VNQ87]|uniref:S9 family peptidase n=1 Tax=Larkinella sp. VNQ87 TaxID=3400921 RepID=UPI003BFEF705
MKKYTLLGLLIGLFLLRPLAGYSQSFTLEAVRSYPFPSELTASAKGSRLAWVFNEQGRRNVYVAEGPTFTPRKLTSYTEDDGQEITSLSISADGNWVVYVRGGDHGSNWDEALPVNTSATAQPLNVRIWSVPFTGGEPKLLSEGDEPVISPKSDQVVFIKNHQVWTAALDGSQARNLFTVRGETGSLQWSPDGARLAFVCNRSDHAFIGVFTNANTPIQWLAPSFARDRSPRWSPDGTKLAFVRTTGLGGAPDSLLTRKHQPWSIWTVDLASGKTAPVWQAPKTLAGSIPTTHGGFNLHWAANDRLVFLSYQDGWPHLYSMPASGGSPLLLTPGPFMAEHIQLSADRKWLLFSGNTGPDKLDIDRRHVVRVPVDKAAMEVLTPGDGLEWTPVLTGDGSTVACLSATAQRPPLPAVMPFPKGTPKLLAQNLIPADFPTPKLVVPKQVVFKSPDGMTVHAQLFEPTNSTGQKPDNRLPAIIYVHGGPSRQMQLGWNYSDYYSNAYAYNQYLTSLGFAVLSVNYRLGIGYGHAFQHPAGGGATGASEYQDIRAAAEWLARQPQIDASRIGVYGGSYGGYLTALALARDSKLFAAGVDIHGVHNFLTSRTTPASNPAEPIPDAEAAAKVAWESSPVSAVGTWTSPVLIIHGDDDRNVRFSQSTDLVRRLEAKGVPMETLVIPDDTHHWMRHANALTVGQATADFFKRKLLKPVK